MKNELLIAQITDFHLDAGSKRVNPLKGDTRERLCCAVAYLNAFEPRPDLVLTTGDLTDSGSAEEYDITRAILDRLEMPNFIIPGNHDRQTPLRQAFAHHGYLPAHGFLHYVVEDYPLRLIGLDTLVPGEGGGALCDDRMTWLENRLAENQSKPTLIFMHHPPYKTGMPRLDEINCRGGSRMAEILTRHTNIEGVVCGHLHRATSARFGGTVATSVPSIAPELALLFRMSDRLDFIPSAPQVGFHFWNACGLVTHIASVPNDIASRCVSP